MDTYTSMSTVIDILSWTESSQLKLYVDNTEIIINGTKQQRNKRLGNDTSLSDTVHNLGVVYDCDFSFHQ